MIVLALVAVAAAQEAQYVEGSDRDAQIVKNDFTMDEAGGFVADMETSNSIQQGATGTSFPGQDPETGSYSMSGTWPLPSPLSPGRRGPEMTRPLLYVLSLQLAASSLRHVPVFPAPAPAGELTSALRSAAGQYSYVAPNGQTVTVTWTADENGYSAQSDAIPQLSPEHQAAIDGSVGGLPESFSDSA